MTSGSHFRDHITHIVQPWLLFRKINSRVDGSICKNIAGIGIEVLLITTSDLDISLLVRAENEDAAYEALKKAYEL